MQPKRRESTGLRMSEYAKDAAFLMKSVVIHEGQAGQFIFQCRHPFIAASRSGDWPQIDCRGAGNETGSRQVGLPPPRSASVPRSLCHCADASNYPVETNLWQLDRIIPPEVTKEQLHDRPTTDTTYGAIERPRQWSAHAVTVIASIDPACCR